MKLGIINNMLTQEDKNKIIKLRQQDFSYQAIHDRLGFAIDTIMKVCNEEVKRKAKESGEEKSQQAEQGQIQGDVVSFDSSIQELRKIKSDIDKVIKGGKLKAEDKKVWERRKEDLQEMVVVEVDDRIAEEREDAVKTRDKQWRELLKQNYVGKEIVTDFENSIKSRDATIKDLENEIVQKDELIQKNQQDMSRIKATHHFEKEKIKDQVRYLLRENNFLKDETARQHNYIENHLDSDVRNWQEQVYHDQEVLNNKKTDFDRYVKAQQSKLEELYVEVDKKEKDVERREKELAEKEDKLRKREDEFDKKINQLSDMLKGRIRAIEKREKNVAELEKRYKR